MLLLLCSGTLVILPIQLLLPPYFFLSLSDGCCTPGCPFGCSHDICLDASRRSIRQAGPLHREALCLARPCHSCDAAAGARFGQSGDQSSGARCELFPDFFVSLRRGTAIPFVCIPPCPPSQNLASFAMLVPSSPMDEVVFPALAQGCEDSQAFVRELALKALLSAAPWLTPRRLNTDALKLLAKLQVDEEPAIRANTTICLGNLAGRLAQATRQRVLVNAFGRALRDPFPLARAAGLQALLATRQFYEPAEVAGRVLPAASPLLVDPEPDVRGHAFRCVVRLAVG